MHPKIRQICFHTKNFSVSHYYKLKGFERDYIQILRLSQNKNKKQKQKNRMRPTNLNMLSLVKR